METRNKSLLENFKKDDLVFGLAGPRGVVVAELKKRGFKFIFANQLNNKVVTAVVKNQTTDHLSEKQKEVYDFMIKHKATITRPNGKPIKGMNKSPSISQGYRRACKLLLTQCHEKTYTVHFLLEGINWERVCLKMIIDQNEEKLDYGVTASELRAIYRDRLKINAGQKIGQSPNIIFYDKNLMPCAAPWDNQANFPFWKQYDEARLSKQKNLALKKELEEASTQEDQPDLEITINDTEDESYWRCDEVLTPIVNTFTL